MRPNRPHQEYRSQKSEFQGVAYGDNLKIVNNAGDLDTPGIENEKQRAGRWCWLLPLCLSPSLANAAAFARSGLVLTATFRGQPLQGFPRTSFWLSALMCRHRGPPARVSPAKTVHRTVFAPFPALAIAYPSRTPAGVLSGDFAACGLRLGGSAPETPARFLRKSGVKPF